MSGTVNGGVPLAPPGTGMISAASPFVAPDFTPTPLSFRFLFELWKDCGDYERRLAALEAKLGVTDGSDAAAGQIGEYLTATGSGSPLSLTPTTIATLTLPAGDWDVNGFAFFNPTVATTGVMAWLNTPDPGRMLISMAPTSTMAGVALIAGPVRFSIVAPSTQAVNLDCQANFSSGTVAVNVWIRARRIR